MIDTDELQEELDKTQTAFRKWAVSTSRTAQEGKASHLRSIRAGTGTGLRHAACSEVVAGWRCAACCCAHFTCCRRCTAGDVESLNDRYHKLERQAAEVQQCELCNSSGARGVHGAGALQLRENHAWSGCCWVLPPTDHIFKHHLLLAHFLHNNGT